jgi:hypothetical protein
MKGKVAILRGLMVACVMLFGSSHAWAMPPLPSVVGKIVQNRDFFASEELWRYAHCRLYDAEGLGDGRVSIVLLTANGVELRIVFDTATRNELRRERRVPAKNRRRTMQRESVNIVNAVRIAKAAVIAAKSK